ncbi:MAG: response regulator [Xenococcaceae cyanobacterium MO_188.B19]|nr:response regulator [Xenococcaceae cyanobacterium MO_188.B19]
MKTNSSPILPNILLVDDDTSIRTTVKAVLEIKGYQVIEAESGEACLNICQTQIPDLILIDAVMPGMDGFTCSSKLKKILSHQCPPILMMTVLDDKDSLYRSFDVGITEYILKPINWDNLTRTMERLLQNRQKHNQLKEQFGELNNLRNTIDKTVKQTLKRYNQESPKNVVSLSLVRL